MFLNMSKCGSCNIKIYPNEPRYMCNICESMFHMNLIGGNCYKSHLFKCYKCKQELCDTIRNKQTGLCVKCSNNM